MKNLFLIFLFGTFLNQAMATNLAINIDPARYIKRSEAVVNIALVYYGDYYKMEDLNRIETLLEERFFKATGSVLAVKTKAKALIPFQHKIENYPDYSLPNVTDPERLQRLWYYDNVGAKVLKNIWELIRKDESYGIDLKNLDALLIVSGAQFDALGFANGRVGITENPMEIAWGLPGGGRVDFVSDAKVVDELIHELGHVLFMDHASTQCQNPKLSYEEKQQCCEVSPSKNDVMSYCRKRNLVNENFFYGFGDCMRRNIKFKVVPALLSGGNTKILNREKCY